MNSLAIIVEQDLMRIELISLNYLSLKNILNQERDNSGLGPIGLHIGVGLLSVHKKPVIVRPIAVENNKKFKSY